VGKNRRVEELEQELEVVREEERACREKLIEERRNIDRLYQDMARVRQEWQGKLDQQV